jgi:hypothetical protein
VKDLAGGSEATTRAGHCVPAGFFVATQNDGDLSSTSSATCHPERREPPPKAD